MLGLKYNADLRTIAFMVVYVAHLAARFYYGPEPWWSRPLLFLLTSQLSFMVLFFIALACGGLTCLSFC